MQGEPGALHPRRDRRRAPGPPVRAHAPRLRRRPDGAVRHPRGPGGGHGAAAVRAGRRVGQARPRGETSNVRRVSLDTLAHVALLGYPREQRSEEDIRSNCCGFGHLLEVDPACYAAPDLSPVRAVLAMEREHVRNTPRRAGSDPQGLGLVRIHRRQRGVRARVPSRGGALARRSPSWPRNNGRLGLNLEIAAGA